MAWLLASLSAVGVAQAPTGQKTSIRGPFALPWELDFARLQLAERRASFRAEQVRRVRERSGQSSRLIGIRESLVQAGPRPPDRGGFSLQYLGPEKGTISKNELRQRRVRHLGRAGFLHDFQSFRIADAKRAAKSYSLLFLGGALRLFRPVYLVAIVPRLPGRSAWLLALDVESGVPLYRGEYGPQGRLITEVEVTRFVLARKNEKLRPSGGWWQPRSGIQEFASAAACTKSLGKIAAILPDPAVLPAGYTFLSAHVSTNLFSGARKGVLIYSDGVDQVFVSESATKDPPLPGGHTIAKYHDVGMTQCTFVHAGVRFFVVGRGVERPVQLATQGLYAQAVRAHP